MYKEKYLKYKSKYLDLQNQLGGTGGTSKLTHLWPPPAPPAPAPTPARAHPPTPPAPAVTKTIFQLRNRNDESELESMTKDSILDYFIDKIKKYDILDFHNCNTITDDIFVTLIQALKEENSKPIELILSSDAITNNSILHDRIKAVNETNTKVIYKSSNLPVKIEIFGVYL